MYEFYPHPNSRLCLSVRITRSVCQYSFQFIFKHCHRKVTLQQRFTPYRVDVLKWHIHTKSLFYVKLWKVNFGSQFQTLHQGVGNISVGNVPPRAQSPNFLHMGDFVGTFEVFSKSPLFIFVSFLCRSFLAKNKPASIYA